MIPLDPDLLKRLNGLGRSVLVFRETASTNDLVLRMGEGNEPEGIAVFAEYQTAGRGQFRRSWDSALGLGLWFSVLLRREIESSRLVRLAPYAAVSVLEGIIEATGQTNFGIKAPNDILGRGGKVAGILVETRTGRRPFVVLGIGINVNHRPQDFPADLRGKASSLFLEIGSELDRHRVGHAVLGRLDARLGELHQEEPAFLSIYHRLVAEWKATLQVRGVC